MTINYKRKLQAFLHDPVDKPFAIKDHENRGAEYLKILDIDYKKPASADQTSSAADRIASFKNKTGANIEINFLKEAELTHPLGSGTLKLTESTNFKDLDLLAIQNGIKKYFKLIKEKYNSDYRKIYLDIWRNFTEKTALMKQKKIRLANFGIYCRQKRACLTIQYFHIIG